MESQLQHLINKANENKTKTSDKIFDGILSEAKLKFLEEMIKRCEDAYENLKSRIEDGLPSTFQRLYIPKDFFFSDIEIKNVNTDSDIKLYKFQRHSLWYGKIRKNSNFTDRIRVQKYSIFNDLRLKMKERGFYIYDLSDPDKSNVFYIVLSLQPIEREKELWHHMN